jgi:hypothetical protein
MKTTPAEVKQTRIETLATMYDIVKIAVGLYKKNPTELGEQQIREIKQNADLYKKKYNL